VYNAYFFSQNNHVNTGVHIICRSVIIMLHSLQLSRWVSQNNNKEQPTRCSLILSK